MQKAFWRSYLNGAAEDAVLKGHTLLSVRPNTSDVLLPNLTFDRQCVFPYKVYLNKSNILTHGFISRSCVLDFDVVSFARIFVKQNTLAGHFMRHTCVTHKI